MQMPTVEPFDPLEFLALARELGESDDQSKLRAAVGRAYYALFLIARDRLNVVTTLDVHTEVINRFGNRKGKGRRDQLFEMKELRLVADYETIPPTEICKDWKRNWERQKLLTLHLLPHIGDL